MSTKTFSWFGKNSATAEETLKFANDLIALVNAKQSQAVFEIAPVEWEIKLNWWDAMDYCESLGKGWRLPTIQELQRIRDNDTLQEVSDFRYAYYWSSTGDSDNKYNDADKIAYQHFFNSMLGINKGLKTQLLWVRPIRDLKIL